MPHSSAFGVLTGDIRNSSALTPDALDVVRGEVHAAVDALFADAPDGLAGFEFFRGDAWQLALHDGAQALRAAVFIRARLRARATADTRVAIALGSVDRLRPERISLSTGEAFTLSGHRLDGMRPKDPGLSAAFSERARDLERFVSAALGLCDVLIDDWTAPQALHVALTLEHPGASQAAIGALCAPPVSQQNVMQSLERASWPALADAITAFEALDWPRRLG